MEKFNTVLIGVLAIGIFMLPAVVSTFTGSHDYIAPENVECGSCHPDILAELTASADDHTHANSTWSEKQVLDCEECHTVDDIGDSPGAGHAARKVDCAICHNKTLFESGLDDGSYSDWAHAPQPAGASSGLMIEYGMDCIDCHREPSPGDNSTMFLDDVYNTITESNAAHYNFYMNAVNDTTYLLGGTESCVGCHSHVDFEITEPLGLNMTYDPLTGQFDRVN